MARTGARNWEDNWKGSDKQSVVKTSAPYYTKGNANSFQSAGQLEKNTPITYIDSLTTTHTKAAFKFDNQEEVYYANIDKFVKPGQVGGISLTPESFGLDNQTYNSSTDYYNKIINSLGDRWESANYSGELYDYLFQVAEYAKTGVSDYAGIKMNGFPWGAIQSYYGEVVGPIACIHRGILNGIIPGGVGGAKIYMPPSSVALYDYKIVIGTNEYLISAKAGKGVSNQVKPQLVKSAVENSLPYNLKNSTAYKLVDILASNSVIKGAFYGWQLLEPSIMTRGIMSDVESNYKSGPKNSADKLADKDSWDPFLVKYFAGQNKDNITYGQVRYKCETLIQNASRQGTLNIDLKKIFQNYLGQSRVIYVKMNVQSTNGQVSFTASDSGDAKIIRTLYLRTSNDSRTRTSDRIGFQVS